MTYSHGGLKRKPRMRSERADRQRRRRMTTDNEI